MKAVPKTTVKTIISVVWSSLDDVYVCSSLVDPNWVPTLTWVSIPRTGTPTPKSKVFD